MYSDQNYSQEANINKALDQLRQADIDLNNVYFTRHPVFMHKDKNGEQSLLVQSALLNHNKDRISELKTTYNKLELFSAQHIYFLVNENTEGLFISNNKSPLKSDKYDFISFRFASID